MDLRLNHLAKIKPKYLEWIWDRKEGSGDTTDAVAASSDMKDRDSAGFVEWLMSDQPMFWVSGKPGSGKFTLMKYLSDLNREPEPLLCITGCQWHIVYFFFDFRASKSVANSLEGMLRSLLAQLVRCSAAVARHVRSTDLGQHVLGGFRNIAYDLLESTMFSCLQATESRVCVIIDGLDEFEGEFEGSYRDLIASLKCLARDSVAKICVSGRPESAFEHAFVKVPRIKMQDFNHGTIVAYTTDLLSAYANDFLDATSVEELVNEIADESLGVFLWVHLVCNDCVNGMFAHETMGELQRRVEFYPRKLDEVYERMLSKSENQGRSEIMVLLYLIHQDHSTSNINHLRVTMQILAQQGMLDTYPKERVGGEDFKYRLQMWLGRW